MFIQGIFIEYLLDYIYPICCNTMKAGMQNIISELSIWPQGEKKRCTIYVLQKVYQQKLNLSTLRMNDNQISNFCESYFGELYCYIRWIALKVGTLLWREGGREGEGERKNSLSINPISFFPLISYKQFWSEISVSLGKSPEKAKLVYLDKQLELFTLVFSDILHYRVA